MLSSLDITSVTPYTVAPYEWAVGTAAFAVDPDAAQNRRIVDLHLAPRDQGGLVRFDADVRILRPQQGGNGRLLVVVPNRGLTGGIPFTLDARLAWNPSGVPDPGDAFLLGRGWTIAWCGWQWDVVREQGFLGLDAPVAEVEPGWLRLEFRPDELAADHVLSDSGPLFQFSDIPTVDLEDPDAILTVRTTPLGQKELIPRNEWRFSSSTRVELDGGFRAFHWYEVVYRSNFAPVVGAGLLAVRDFTSHLRAGYDAAFGFGVSQSGRFLRQFLFEGLNVDEVDRKVFDGVFGHIASARRGEFNMRFGQPSLTHPLTPGYGPPYDTTSLLTRQRELGGVPKIFFTNSSWEYWRGDGALVHQDAETGADLPEDADARTYLISGTDHIGAAPIKAMFPVANPTHVLDALPVLRALLVQLELWVCDDVEPPPSRVPRRSDGSAVSREEVLEMFKNGHLPDPAALPGTPDLDPDSFRWPLELGRLRPALVSAVDADGNEVSGVRLPEVAVPAAAYTGWNPRRHVEGLPDVLYEFVGSRLPPKSGGSPMDQAAREVATRAVAANLVADRLLLPDDLDRVVAGALQCFDA
jgi:hypothetical protein